MMTRKTRMIIIGLILLAVLIFIILLLWYLFPRNEQTKTPQQELAVTIPVQESKEPTIKEQELIKEQESRNQSSGVVTVSKMFVERYGSYSNEANFQNLVDVLTLMTDKFAQETRLFIDSSTPPEVYYGVTTRVLVVNTEKMDEQNGLATVLINTQREISEGSTQNTKVSYQEIRLELIKQEGTWKVDSATWL